MAKAHTPQQGADQFSAEEAQRRFEAALRGARIVGHKPQSEMKLGKPRVTRKSKRKATKPSR
jgi:hypothetical protein